MTTNQNNKKMRSDNANINFLNTVRAWSESCTSMPLHSRYNVKLHRNLGTTSRDLTQGENTTWPGASYISKEEVKKIAIRKNN
jgi:hypothetical protein